MQEEKSGKDERGSKKLEVKDNVEGEKGIEIIERNNWID